MQRRKAISEMLAVIIMLALTIVAGAFVYQVFFSRSSTYSNVSSITIQSAEISNGEVVLTVKNTGSTTLSSLGVQIYYQGNPQNPNGNFGTITSIPPSSTAVYTGTMSEQPGYNYLIVVTASTSNNGEVEATTTVTAS